MLLVVDIGNTNVKAILYKERKEEYFEAIYTLKDSFGSYYQKFFERIYKMAPEIESYVFCSVVPSISDEIHQILKDLYHQEGLVVNSDLVKDLTICLKNREELGADLIATTYGALSQYKTPAIIADLGTATKITVIQDDHTFYGGLILPGLTISNRAMQETIPHLPKIELKLPEKLINEDTIKCMQAGLLYGTIYQVRGLVDALEEEIGMKATRILTGGYGKFVSEKMTDFIFDEYLGSKGLVELYYRYKEN